MVKNKLFGTDGIRGITGERLTAGAVFRVGKALAVISREEGKKPKIIVGRDTRTSGDMIECALCSGLTAFGADVVKVGIMPTPALPYLIKKTGATAGIMVTASHNPPEYNGLKLFGSDGNKLSDEKEQEIEEVVANEGSFLPNSYDNLGNIVTDEDLLKLYSDFLLQQLGNINLKGMRVYLDCCNGAAFRIAPYIFKTMGAQVKTINAQPNGALINTDCGSEHPEGLAKVVVSEKFDIGFCFDGDADRVVAIMGNGKLARGDEMLYVFAKALANQGKLMHNTVVGTVLTNFGLEKSLAKLDIALMRTDVGDKHLKALMEKDGYNLGGEESGHIILADFNFTGDGMLAAMFLCKILKEANTTLETEICHIEKFPQVRIDVPVSELIKPKILKNPKVCACIEAAEDELAEYGRVVVRPSGTESVLRIMVEGSDLKLIERIATSIEKAVREVK